MFLFVKKQNFSDEIKAFCFEVVFYVFYEGINDIVVI